MVQEYADKFYMPHYKTVLAMNEDKMKEGLAYANWRSKLNGAWKFVKIRRRENSTNTIKVGANIEVTAMVDLGQLTPEDVRVQVVLRQVDDTGHHRRTG